MREAKNKKPRRRNWSKTWSTRPEGSAVTKTLYTFRHLTGLIWLVFIRRDAFPKPVPLQIGGDC